MKFKILCAGTWRPEQVAVHDSARAFVLPQPHADRAEDYWQTLLAVGDKHLFNGQLFRLESLDATSGSLSLHLSRTCYRDQIYSNAHAEQLLGEFGTHSLAHGLGVSALVLTADGYVPVIRRGQHLGEEPGKLDVVGGHAHPDQHIRDGRPDLFRAIVEELETELNLPASELSANVCCGVVENRQIRKPDLVFLTRTRATMGRLENQIAFAAEADEIAELLALAVAPAEITRFLETHQEQLTPSACACLHLLAKR